MISGGKYKDLPNTFVVWSSVEMKEGDLNTVAGQLWKWWEQRVGPVVKSYRSDLFHDAMYFRQAVQSFIEVPEVVTATSKSFCGSYDSCGTNISVTDSPNMIATVRESNGVGFTLWRLRQEHAVTLFDFVVIVNWTVSVYPKPLDAFGRPVTDESLAHRIAAKGPEHSWMTP